MNDRIVLFTADDMYSKNIITLDVWILSVTCPQVVRARGVIFVWFECVLGFSLLRIFFAHLTLARNMEVSVFWKHCVLVFVLGILQFVFSPDAAAQASSCYSYVSAHDLGIDLGAPVPPGAVLVNQNTVPGEGGLSIYRLTLATCAPSAAASETCPLCPSAAMKFV